MTWRAANPTVMAMENTTIVETHGLTKRYGSGVLAVNSIDMSVRRGEVYGFLGPNGAGETTTLLILDEPTNGLDPQGMAEMRKLIKDIGQGERTVLLSSHLLGEVEQICDRVGVISNGKLVKQSSVQDLLGEKGVVVRAEPSEKASEVLTRMFGAASVVREDGYFHLKTDPARSMEINQELINAGIGVSELRPFERSLEEVFFQLTGEKQGS